VATPDCGIATSFGPGMLVVGNVVSTGPVNVSGRVIGDIHAAQLTIYEGGRVDGHVTAPDAVILGALKGAS
jgi:cytoskeletal protein CcmA (bactofilin family)